MPKQPGSRKSPRRLTRNRPQLGEMLVRSGLIDEDDLKVALELQEGSGTPLGTVLVELGLASERQIIQVLSRQLQVPSMDLDVENLSSDATRFVDVQVAERFNVFPISADPKQGLLRVATADPTSVEALEALTAQTGMMVVFVLSAESTISRTIRRFYRPEEPRRTPSTEIRLAEVEALLQEQSMAVRSMLELLDKKGVVSREEVLDRLMPAVHKPPPLPLRRTGHQRWLPLLREDS